MLRTPERSSSESNLTELPINVTTPMRFANLRNKRKRPEDSSGDLNDFKTEMKDMLSTWMAHQKNETTQICSSLKNIETSLTFLSAQYDEMFKKIEELEREKKKDKEQIVFLENKIEDLQKSHRKSSFELKNVPRVSSETKSCLVNMVTNLATSLNVDIHPGEISDIYRSSKKGEATPIVVELTSYIKKTNLLQAAKKFNIANKSNKINSTHLGMKGNSTAVYLSDHLTQRGNRLYYLARELAKAQKYRFCWTSLGDVLVRKDENSPIIKIINESQIQRLYQQDNI
ncbi:hypothetical protein JYU34_020391 [Plutella xylostella]|uniref:FP protein C-terminal domain-containing protein n=1 Tax=Plutella xylostella TaxID=51655 RepID=A0ABQ7PUL0_PLUXY|nr:hypothetical protein JYU34_020391 [Plutella xylostella]